MIKISVIPIEGDSEKLALLRCVLGAAGIPQTALSEEVTRGKGAVCIYGANRRKAEIILKRIRKLKIKGVRISTRRLGDDDWKTRWKKYAEPFWITPEILIVPVYKQLIGPADKDKVYIDTLFAFGTGLHATTQMMAGFIRARRGRLNSFLDVGTGSGILAIIASRYGCRMIWAIDCDREAVRTARRNAAANGVRAVFAVKPLENLVARRRYDFVAANLLTGDLIRLQKKLIPRVCRGGYLAVSGIHRDNYALFHKRFIHPQLVCRSVKQKMGWYALLYQRA